MVNLVNTNFQQQGINALNTGMGIGNAMQRTQQLGIDRERQAQADLQNQQLFGQKSQINQQSIQQNQQAIEQQDKVKGMGQLITALNLPYDKRQDFLANVKAERSDPDAQAFISHLETLDDEDQMTAMVQLLNSQQGAKAAKDTRTTKKKDFDTYVELKKTNPEEASAFGISAGFINNDKKRVFKIEDGIKYYSDGTEEAVEIGDDKAKKQTKALEVIDKAREGQLKNAGFAITMNDGVNKVNSMVDSGYDPTSAAWVNKYLAGTTLGNLAMTEDDQVFVGAVEQMINAIARRETGAAITEFEKKDFFNRYMPVAGDKPKRIKQKKSALERQFKSIRGQAGSVYDAIRTTQDITDDNSTTKTVNWADL